MSNWPATMPCATCATDTALPAYAAAAMDADPRDRQAVLAEAAAWIHCAKHRPASARDDVLYRRFVAEADAVETGAQLRDAYYRAVAAFAPRDDYASADLAEPGRAPEAQQTLEDAAAAVRAGGQAAVVLAGPVGTGKTRAAFALLNDLASGKYGLRARFGTEYELVGTGKWKSDRAAAADSITRDVEALLIDDVGTAYLLDDQAERHVMWQRIVQNCASRPGRFLLVLTTNLRATLAPGESMSDLVRWIGPYARDRMNTMTGFTGGSACVAVGSRSWRGRQTIA